ncbi:MAG: energy transducer TonB [Spirochaetota bacterium]|nr:energy transducer TonB [Spirochaetota bacterium]
MKFTFPKKAENIKYLILALLISVLLYLLLPVSYYLFYSQVNKILNAREAKTVKVDVVQIQKKERKILKIEKPKKKRLERFQKKFFSRFDLDLSVLSSEDGGPGIMASGFENVIEEGEADIPPIKRIFMPPRYPTRAKEEGIEAKVIAKLLIDEMGNVVRVRIIDAPRFWGFGEAVIEASKNWKFEPAKLNNLPVKVWATQVVEFRL